VTPPRIEEPLLESAPLAWQRAPQLCRKDPATGEDCSWYHRIWQYLRLMGLGGSPGIHADFYRRALNAVAPGTMPPRLLISGAADYSMLAHLLVAFGGRGATPEVTVVDHCETPLWLNRWYADRMSRQITTCRCDISEFRTDRPFDAICTHSFFGQIPGNRRPGLLAAWRELLRPGGLAITADRVRPASSNMPIGFNPEQARVFRATVLSQAERLGGSLEIEPAELARHAAIYAGKQRLHPVRSRAEVQELFERAGFRIVEELCVPNEAGTRQEDSGPAIPAKADYALFIASRV
jgi:hypothetical protein